jgi:hypothetical protein
MSLEISSRVFIVGCPRSGTTLLQSLLAANSKILSFPETHFYEMIVGGRLRSALSLPSKRAKPYWYDFLEEIGHPELGSILPKNAIFIRQYSNAFIQALDTIAQSQDKTVWLEKTPGHLRQIDQINKLVPRVRFIHIIRNGKDTIASINELGNQYPETWGRWYRSLDRSIQRWVTDVRISIKYATNEKHRLVRYEELIQNPKIVLENLCAFIGVPFEENMLADHLKSADQIILDREPWKASVQDPIWPNRKHRFYDFLNDEQREYIHMHIPDNLLEYF